MKTIRCPDCGGNGQWDDIWGESERAERCGRCFGTGRVAADASAIPTIAESSAPLLERCHDVMAALFCGELPLDVRDFRQIGEMFGSTDEGEAQFLALEAAFDEAAKFRGRPFSPSARAAWEAAAVEAERAADFVSRVRAAAFEALLDAASGV